MTEEEAIKALEEAKLKVEKVEEESKKVDAGHVISQETEPNTQVHAGDTVVIHISTGVKKAAVPSVIGKNEDEAKKTLSDLGLTVNVSYEEDSSKDNGAVLKQSIDTGKEVEVGTSITITVNKLTETKSATLTVNVRSLLGGEVNYEEDPSSSENTTNETSTSTNKKVKNVRVRITVNDESVYDKEVDPTTTNLVQTISGKITR